MLKVNVRKLYLVREIIVLQLVLQERHTERT